MPGGATVTVRSIDVLSPFSDAVTCSTNSPGENGTYAIHPPSDATSAGSPFTETIAPGGAAPNANDFATAGMLAPSLGYTIVSGGAASPVHLLVVTIAATSDAAASRAHRGGKERDPKETDCMLKATRGAALAALLVAVSIACISCQQKPTPSNGQMVVYILGDKGSNSFSPGKFTVSLGTIVTWINQDTEAHTVTDPGVFDSGPIPPNGGRWSWGASVVGTFTYHSLIQPDMNGTVIVTSPTQTSY
jgi:plastocyanin